MYLFNIILLLYSINLVYGYPTNITIPGYKKLTPEQRSLLEGWTKDSKQSKWELSGQVEGDMIFSPEQRNGLINLRYRWPNRELPYVLDQRFTTAQKNHIRSAVVFLNMFGCVNVRPAVVSDEHVLYVTADQKGSVTEIGYRGIPLQYLNLEPAPVGEGCFTTGIILHEFLHALGFIHMHNDATRDDFVYINFNNVNETAKGEFKKLRNTTVTSFGLRYDYYSIMHYAAYAFSNNGLPTIIPLVNFIYYVLFSYSPRS